MCDTLCVCACTDAICANLILHARSRVRYGAISRLAERLQWAHRYTSPTRCISVCDASCNLLRLVRPHVPLCLLATLSVDHRSCAQSYSRSGDVTIGEGEEVPPNTTFRKTWRVGNPGPEPWPPSTILTFCQVGRERESERDREIDR